MCDYCSKIISKDSFQTPNEYEKMIDSIKELIENQHFIFGAVLKL